MQQQQLLQQQVQPSCLTRSKKQETLKAADGNTASRQDRHDHKAMAQMMPWIFHSNAVTLNKHKISLSRCTYLQEHLWCGIRANVPLV